MVRAGLTADRVTRAAADLADEVGFENVKVSVLARGFGVKDASLYSHVRNLQDLRSRVAMLAARDLAGRITAAVAGRAGRDALVAFAHAYRDFAHRHPGRYAAVQIPLPPQVAADSAGHLAIIETTYAMLRAYGLAEPDLTDAVRLLRSAIHGFVSLEAAGGFGASRAVQASWDRSLDALHTLLENWPASR
ncbi:TetR-like C-terminal domain-containing protein [Micromonospora sp. WMMD882]|uniref:TetR/AcrR family transcriptional regulator n=1 Tax=Micromonospora sp. WMMD882 TaxID=3015151 RepID=UPI00248CD171|nr:TetR-like C-terminal domain-containing protein [Micromonospora sp. WMMD882]WBB81913.1 TetR-like C-terminal domain-containing protein [Micromonospora sp. WMMD882]